MVYSRSSTFDLTGKLLSDATSTVRPDATYGTSTWYSYSSGSEYLLGAVASMGTNNTRNGVSQGSSTTTNAFQWWNGAMQSAITYVQGSSTFTTELQYDSVGTLKLAMIQDGRPRRVYYRANTDGQVIHRGEEDYGSGGDPHETWYRFGGREWGYVSNNGTSKTSEAASITDRTAVGGSGPFRNGSSYGNVYNEFSHGYDPINSYSQGGAAGAYTVQRTGESLRGIAQALWGDASLWYKLAEANGLSAETSLIEGQRLTVPAGVIRSTYNAGTVKPYDPAGAIGNVQPTTPKPVPPNKKSCLGQIFLAILAIAVTFVLKVPLQGVFGKVGGLAAAAMAGSVVSQGVGVATGLQDKFSFGAVAMAGIGAVVGGLVDKIPGLDKIAGSAFLGDVAKGALGSAITQGIGVATGLQDKFSWAGVAAAGIGNGVGLGLAREMGKANGFFGLKADAGSFASDALSTGASTLANAATRSAIEGSNFGDNIVAALPDAIGGVLGRALGGAALRRGQPGNPQNLLSGTPFDAAANPVAMGGGTFGQRASHQITRWPSIKGVSFKPISPYAFLAPNFNDNVVHYGFDDIRALGDYAVGKLQAGIEFLGEEISPFVEDIQEIVVTGARAVQGAALEAEDALNSFSNSILQFNISLDAKIAPYRKDLATYLPPILQPMARLAGAYASQAASDISSAMNKSAGFQMPRAFDTAMRIGGSLGSPLGTIDVVRTHISVVAHPEMITGMREGTYGDVAAIALTAASAGRGAIVARANVAARAAAMEGIAAESRILTQSHPGFIGPREFVGPLPAITFSRARTPGIANNIEAGIANGHPSVLTRLEGRDAIRAQRADARAGQARPPSRYSLDEFPFASTRQGGAGAQVAQVPVIEQNIQGGMLSSFYQKYGITHGAPFKVIVVP